MVMRMLKISKLPVEDGDRCQWFLEVPGTLTDKTTYNRIRLQIAKIIENVLTLVIGGLG